MFEDFKEKVRELEDRRARSPMERELPPKVLEEARWNGVDPDNFTLGQLWPAFLDDDGVDLSLLSAFEVEVLVNYAELRKYLFEKYPLSELTWDGSRVEPCDIDAYRAREDPKGKMFGQLVIKAATIFDKIGVLQAEASEYEKICVRLYLHLTHNWNHASDVAAFRAFFDGFDGDIFEIVETYFKICRKYHVPVFEKPYYFLSEERKLSIKLEGDMLKRTGGYCENEIRISFLDGIP